MRVHAVRLEASPAPELRAPASAPVRGVRRGRLKARNLPVPGHEASGAHIGVQMDVTLPARNLDEALQSGYVAAQDFLIELAVAGAARCGLPEPRTVVDIDPATTIHPFRQYIRVHPDVSRRRVKPQHLQIIRGTLERFSGQARGSIWRGMTAYAQALAATDPLVEFLLLWIAVEAMNVPLGRRRRIRNPRPKEGTRAFFELRVPGGKQLYKRAYDLRNRFAHGARDLASMTKDADELVGPMRARPGMPSPRRSTCTGLGTGVP